MRRATPQMRELAKRLIAHDTKRKKSPALTDPEAFQVCEKLRPQLSALMGSGGFHALLARALALAQKEAPALRAVRVNANGNLRKHRRRFTRATRRGQIFRWPGRPSWPSCSGLLAAFIGENLTLRLLREVWPKVVFDDSDFGKG